MSASRGWSRKQTFVVVSLFAAPACAMATEEPVTGIEIPSNAGLGGELAGTSGIGGSTGGGSGGGVGGTGGAGKGGTNAAGASGATSSAGSGTGGGGSGVGGAPGGTSSLGGKGGGAGQGGTTTTGGKGGTGGAGGASSEMSGCAELSVPLNAANDKAHFTISLTGAADLTDTGTTISLRVYVEAGTGGRIFAYAQDSEFDFLAPAAMTRPLLAEQNGWVSLTWNIAAEPAAMSGMSKSSVTRIGIEIQAAPSMTWSNPTVVYVDSISVNSTPALSFGFGMRGTVSTATNQTTDPSGQTLWLNAGSTDTTAAGSTLRWVETCP